MNFQLAALFVLLINAMSCVAMRKADSTMQHTDEVFSLEMSISFIPEPFQFLKTKYFAYEIEIKNGNSTPFMLDGLDIYDAASSTLIKSYDLKTLNFAYLDRENKPISSDGLQRSERALIYIWLEFPLKAAIPAKLDHQLKGHFGNKPIMVHGKQIEVPTKAPIAIGSPFKDNDTWYAANGPAPSSSHRKAVTPVAGALFMPQRFAIDWMAIGEDNRAFRHDGEHILDWYGYGKELIAVANGTIRGIRDDIMENPINNRSVEINLDTALGNYVALEIDTKHLAVYAHLMPKSVRVKIGDKVKKGQVLGRIGNSGNSDAPHLHLHICEGPHPLLSQGQSYSLEAFSLLGMSAGIEGLLSGGNVMSPFLFERQEVKVHDQLALDNALLKL